MDIPTESLLSPVQIGDKNMLRIKLFIPFLLAFLLIPVSITHAWISEVDGTLCWNGDVNFPILRSYRYEGIASTPDEGNVLKTFLVVDLNATKCEAFIYDVVVHTVHDPSQRIIDTYHWLFRAPSQSQNTRSLYYASKDSYQMYGNKSWVHASRNAYRSPCITNIRPEQYEAYQHAAHNDRPDTPISFLPPRRNSFEVKYYKNLAQNISPYDDLQRRVNNAYWETGFDNILYGYSKYDYSSENCYIDSQGYVRGLELHHSYESGETRIEDLQFDVIKNKMRSLGKYYLNGNGKIECIPGKSTSIWLTPDGNGKQYCSFLRDKLSEFNRE